MMQLVVESFYIPKEKPGKPYGDDAHFFNKAAQVIGVADGVGGWAKKGVDAGEYARELMRNAENAVYYCRPGKVDPMKVLVEAFHRTEAPGSSTALIMALAGDNNLVAVNIGDSGFVVIRNGETFFGAPQVQHGFNHPGQLGNYDKCDLPEDAQEMSVKLEVGDVVVAGTDGLFDNLYLTEIEEIVDACMDWSRLPEDLARAANLRSGRHDDVIGPFAEDAQDKLSLLEEKTSQGEYRHDIKYARFKSRYGHIIDTGLKKDDITVVVAHVVPKGIEARKNLEFDLEEATKSLDEIMSRNGVMLYRELEVVNARISSKEEDREVLYKSIDEQRQISKEACENL
ncbi:hypothetical protein ABFX02_09G099800 [Erythranthe guttata]